MSTHLDRIGESLVRKLGGHWRHGKGLCRCPAHPDRRPSLSIRVGTSALLYKCWAGCDTRDVIREILRLDGKALDSIEEAGPAPASFTADLWRRQRALHVWDAARQLSGTPAEIYLRRRRIAILPPALRFHARTPLGGGERLDYRPAMIAAVHEGDRFVAIQRTFLDRDDARRARDLIDPRMMLGRPHRGAVVLAPSGQTLGLSEGVETALSAMMLFDIPVWAALGSERLDQVAIPTYVTRLVLFPDNDMAGEIGAAKAMAAYAMPGRQIDVEFPPARFKDWNDVLLAGGQGVGK
ncbi:DUF7146 domain-containing protein [Sphingobium sp. EP60837]|uniref:DUF7146 domain-containing protein n=1 Tax=Sphingobium sp. EP60837 TaxID=1855519 RepID=UPI0007DDA4B9|nr:toprim domain-containing protein [Sphingobium sp. EP60837]ANI79169.1 hypothetical protein EP837_02775 [Sphingobium sp. EP60837]